MLFETFIIKSKKYPLKIKLVVKKITGTVPAFNFKFNQWKSYSHIAVILLLNY